MPKTKGYNVFNEYLFDSSMSTWTCRHCKVVKYTFKNATRKKNHLQQCPQVPQVIKEIFTSKNANEKENKPSNNELPPTEKKVFLHFINLCIPIINEYNVRF